MKNITDESKIERGSCSYLDNYHDQIASQYAAGLSIVKIHSQLLKSDKTIKYTTLKDYINRHIKNNIFLTKCSKAIYKIVTRNDIKKYILNWNCPEEKVKLVEEYLLSEYPEIKQLHVFYMTFKKVLISRDCSSMKKIINHTFVNQFIRKYIESLSSDYNAVINSARYFYNNSQVEGQVSKLKRIKHNMYGRSGIQLLKNRIIFESLFF